MTKAHPEIFEKTLQKTQIWLNDLIEESGITNSHEAFAVLRATLHALRDRLPVEIAAKFSAQLPMLIRGLYYEGYKPSDTPIKVHNVEDFCDFVCFYMPKDLVVDDLEKAIRAVLTVIKKHVSEGEVSHIMAALPRSIATFLQ